MRWFFFVSFTIGALASKSDVPFIAASQFLDHKQDTGDTGEGRI